MRTIEHAAALARMEDVRRAAAQARLARQSAERRRPRHALSTLLTGVVAPDQLEPDLATESG